MRETGSGGQGQGKRGDDGVAGAGYVGHLIGAKNRKVPRRASGLEEDHALAATRDQQGLERLAPQHLHAQTPQQLQVVANPLPERFFNLGLVRRGRGHASVAQHIIAGIERKGQAATVRAPAPPAQPLHRARVRCSVAVIRNEHGGSSGETRPGALAQPAARLAVERSGGLAIHPNDLLRAPV